MKLARHLLAAALPALLTLACSEAPQAPEEPTGGAVAEQLPVTAASPEALADFEAGRAKLEVGRELEAREYFQSAVEKDPTFSMAYLGLAEASFSAQEFKQSVDLALESVAGKSEAERILVDMSRTYLTNDADERLALAERLTRDHPASPRAWQALGYTHYGRGEHQEARDAFDRAVELDPAFIGGYFGLWNSYLFADPKDFERSKEAMEKALEIAEGEAQLYQCLGDTHRAMNDLETARSYYGEAIERDAGGPAGAVASLKKGHINSFLGNYEEARADYDIGLAAAAAHNKPQYANYRTFVHVHADDPDAALAELGALLDGMEERGLPEDQQLGADAFTLGNSIHIALHVGRLELARELIDRWSAVLRTYAVRVDDPDFARHEEAEIALVEGQLLARSGDFEGALAQADRIRELTGGDSNPRSLEAFHGLTGLVELLRGDYESAVGHFEQSDLMKAYVKYHLALALEGAGRAEEAKSLFREVAEWNFNSVGYALVRRDALARAS